MFDITIWIVIGILTIWLLYQKLAANKGIHTITTEELKQMLVNKKYQFIDVRTPSEFSRNHIEGFKNIPLSQLSQRMNEVLPEHEVFVICQSGMRSAKACQLLKKTGFDHVTNIKGGIGSYRG